MATTDRPLYRVGNQDAQLDRIRNKDVAVYSIPLQAEIWVRCSVSFGATPGLSTWDTYAKARKAAQRGGVWQLPLGATYDDGKLWLWETRTGSGHWIWSPKYDMPGSVFIAALRDVNTLFQP